MINNNSLLHYINLHQVLIIHHIIVYMFRYIYNIQS